MDFLRRVNLALSQTYTFDGVIADAFHHDMVATTVRKPTIVADVLPYLKLHLQNKINFKNLIKNIENMELNKKIIHDLMMIDCT